MKVHNVYTITVVERDWQTMAGAKAPEGVCVEAVITAFDNCEHRYPVMATGSTLIEALENMAKTLRLLEAHGSADSAL